MSTQLMMGQLFTQRLKYGIFNLIMIYTS